MIHFHHWLTVKDTGHTRYQICTDCGKRRYQQGKGGYQPIDLTWVNTGKWQGQGVPPKGKGVGNECK